MRNIRPAKSVMIRIIVLAGLLCVGSTVAAAQGSKRGRNYRPKNGVLSLKGEVFGGEFRVTNVIPLHGDFSKYNRLEIVRLESLIGPKVPSEVLNQYTEQVSAEFEQGGHFQQVEVVNSWPKSPPQPSPSSPVNEDFRQADALEAPMLSWADMVANDARRQQAAHLEDERAQNARTLVVRGQVIDYAKGNKYLDLLPLYLGSAIFTVRFSYYDKETREELGRQIISSEAGGKVVPMLFSVRNTTRGLVEGVVDQITRREVGAER